MTPRSTILSLAVENNFTEKTHCSISPLDPIAFSEPVLRLGKRIRVKYFDPEKQVHRNGKALTACAHCSDEVKRAYLPITNKRIGTGLGYVDICNVLIRHNDESCDNDSNGTFQLTDEVVVVKVSSYKKKSSVFSKFIRNRDEPGDDPRQEVAAMQFIGNDLPNVTGFLDVLEDTSNKSLNLILPYYSAGSLQDLFPSENSPTEYNQSEDFVRSYFRQVMEGLKQLHSCGVCHRDLSLDNIMLDGDICVIIDLGLSLQMPSNDCHQRAPIEPQGQAGKWGYISPEIYKNKEAFDGEKVDVWSAGVILYQLLTGFGSYKLPSENDLIFKIMTDPTLLQIRLKEWGVNNVSSNAMDLFHKMLKIDPNKRLNVEEVLSHPWFDN